MDQYYLDNVADYNAYDNEDDYDDEYYDYDDAWDDYGWEAGY